MVLFQIKGTKAVNNQSSFVLTVSRLIENVKLHLNEERSLKENAVQVQEASSICSK